ncbi:MAG TPA: chitosanase [Kofleriaceae bacterium]
MRRLFFLLLLGACGGSSSSDADVGADSAPSSGVSLATPVKKEIFLEMVNTAEQSALAWTTAYPYCEDINDGRGYTTGIVGFTTDSAGATTDDGPGVLGVVQYYDGVAPGNALHKYLSALQMTAASGTGSHTKIDAVGSFCPDWATAATDEKFTQAQQHDFDVTAFDPARELAIADGLGVLGQAIYVDDSILNGYGGDPSLTKDVQAAKAMAQTPAQGGDEATYLNAFLAAYRASILADAGHAGDGSEDRVDTMWGPLVTAGNFSLATPLHWTMYGDPFSIDSDPTPDPALSQDW